MAVLGSTTLTGCSTIPDFIANGTIMPFQQTNAPTNWTKLTSQNDKALRVVSGNVVNGGVNPFTNTFVLRPITGSTGNTSLSSPTNASHTHTINNGTSIWRNAPFPLGIGGAGINFRFTARPSANPMFLNNNGSSGSHSHPASGTYGDFRIQYVDLIIASKDA
jgi:hypothetical protein